MRSYQSRLTHRKPVPPLVWAALALIAGVAIGAYFTEAITLINHWRLK